MPLEMSFDKARQALLNLAPEEREEVLKEYPYLQMDKEQINNSLKNLAPEEQEEIYAELPEFRPRPAGGVMDALSIAPDLALQATGQMGAGLIQQAQEVAPSMINRAYEGIVNADLGGVLPPQMKQPVDPLVTVPQGDIDIMAATAQQAQQNIQNRLEEKNIQPGTLPSVVANAASSVVQQAPIFAAAALGGPVAGAAGLAALGLGSMGARYTDARRAGYTPEEATLESGMFALAEVIPEKLGMDAIFAAAKNPAAKAGLIEGIKRIAIAAGISMPAEALEEGATQIAQNTIRKYGRPASERILEKPVERITEGVGEAMATGALAGGALGGGIATLNRLLEPGRTAAPQRPIQQPRTAVEEDIEDPDVIRRAEEEIMAAANAQERQGEVEVTPEGINTRPEEEPPAETPEIKAADSRPPVLNVNEIKQSPELQFKRNVDKNLVTDKLKGRKYNPLLAGTIDVFVNPEDGETYVWNGNHRLVNAKENNIPEVKVAYTDFANMEEARANAILKNLAENNGEPLDYRNFFKEANEAEFNALKILMDDKGIDISKGMAVKGYALSKLNDYLTSEYERGVLPEGVAVEIGKAQLSEPDQNALYKHIKAKYLDNKTAPTNGQIRNLVEFARSAPKQEGEADLFGDTEIINQMGIKSEIAEYVGNVIKKDKNILKKLSNEDMAGAVSERELGEIKTEQAAAEAQKAALAEMYFKKRMFAKGDEISKALNDATQRVIDGEAANKVKADTFLKVRKILESEATSGLKPVNEKPASVETSVTSAEPKPAERDAATESVVEDRAKEEEIIEYKKNPYIPEVDLIDYDKSVDNVLTKRNGTILLKNSYGNVAVITPSAKEKGRWQITKFDAKGPIGDSVRDTEKEAVKEGLESGYQQFATQQEFKNLTQKTIQTEMTATLKAINKPRAEKKQPEAKTQSAEPKIKIADIKTIEDLATNQAKLSDAKVTSIQKDKATINFKGKEYNVSETPTGLKFEEYEAPQPKAKQEGLFEEDLSDKEKDQKAGEKTGDMFGGDYLALPKGKEPWQMTKAQFDKENVIYHGGPEIEGSVLKRGAGGKRSDMGGLFFTDNKQYAEQYAKPAVYEVNKKAFRNLFDARKPAHMKKLRKYYEENDMLSDFKIIEKSDLLDWSIGSQYAEEIEEAGFDGAVFRERPGNISKKADGSFNVEGEPIYSIVSFKKEIPASRNLHKDIVKQAIAEGKAVPAEVLAEYPDLKKDSPITGDYLIAPMSNNQQQAINTLAGLDQTDMIMIIEALEADTEVKKRLRNKAALGQFVRKDNGKIQLPMKMGQADKNMVAKVLAHELGHLIDWSTGAVKNKMPKGNIFAHIGAMAKYFKKTLNLDPGGTPQNLTTKERAKIRREAKAVLKEEGQEFDTQEAYNAALKATYHQFIAEYIEDNNLITRETAVMELLDFTQKWWNIPDDQMNDEKFLAYLSKPTELYANAFSAFLTEPATFEALAPQTSQMIYDYMVSERPEFYQIYKKFQAAMIAGESNKNKLSWLRDRMALASQKRLKYKLTKAPDTSPGLKEELIDMMSPLLDLAVIPGSNKLDFDFIDKVEMYRDSRDVIEGYLREFMPEISEELSKAGLSIDNIGIDAFLKRIIGERGGKVLDVVSKEKAEELNQELQNNYTPEQMQAVNNAFVKLWQQRKKNILEPLKQNEFLPKEVIDYMLNNEDYFNWDIGVPYEKIYSKVSPATGAAIKKQIGTFKAVANPFISTVLKDVSLLRFLIRQIATKSTIDKLQQLGMPIQEAKKKYNGAMWQFVEPDIKSGLELVMLSTKDKIKGYYLDKSIARALENKPLEINSVVKLMLLPNKAIRGSFTGWNPAFLLLMNPIRDVQGAFLKSPYALQNFGTWSKEMASEIYKALANTQDQKQITELTKEGILIGEHETVFDPDLIKSEEDYVKTMYEGQKRDYSKYNMALGKLMGLFDMIMDAGKRLERAPRLAGDNFYKQIKQKYNLTDAEIKYFLRNFSGSPDFRRKGSQYANYNNILLYSNAAKEGYRAQVDAAKYALAEYLTKLTLLSAIPTVTQLIAEAAFKDWYDKVPEYIKTNYFVIPWPFGPYDANGKPVYLTLPKDEMVRMVSSMMRKLWKFDAESKLESAIQIMAVGADEVPTGSPILKAAGILGQAVSGNIPTDSRTGRPLISQRDWDVRVKDPATTYTAIAKALSNSVGGGTWYKFDPKKKDNVSEPSDIERWTKMPLFGMNILGRFLRVGDLENKQAGYDDAKEKRGTVAYELNQIDEMFDSKIKPAFKENKNIFKAIQNLTPDDKKLISLHERYYRDKLLSLTNPDLLKIKKAAQEKMNKTRFETQRK